MGGFLAICLILFMKDIFTIFIDVSYQESIQYVVFGITSVFLLGSFHIVNIPYYNARKSTRIAFVSISGALLNVLLNYLFIQTYGIWAAGFASVIAYLYIYLMTLGGANRISTSKFSIIPVIIIIPVMFMINLINTQFDQYNQIVTKIAILLVISMLTYNTGVFKILKQTYKGRN